MDKLKMHSLDNVKEHIAQIGALFPNTLTETIQDGKVVQAIDFDLLRQELSDVLVEGPAERYQFIWPDKRKSILLANAPIAKTLRPCREESVDFDTTENLYIEGDNLDALKLLQETYLGKVKMIYIDPPYNTGNDFVYEDDFAQSTANYLTNSGQFDEEGGRLVTNLESNGRFHTDWLNMMYPRLKLAKDLLTVDGVIFISIDDSEVHNLRKICDDIFGADNFIANIVWQKKYSPQNDAKYFSDMHDHIICYAKKKISTAENIGWHRYLLPRTAEQNARYKNLDNDPRGLWKSSDLSVKTYSASYDYPITTPSGRVVNPPAGGCWRVSKEGFNKMVDENRIWFGPNEDGVPAIKRFLSEVQDGRVPTTWWKREDVGDNQSAAQEIGILFDGARPFDTPKPTSLIKMLLLLSTRNDDLVMDFFSGSATTADAVMQINNDDGENRKFILVQIPEEIPDKSVASKSGFSNICDVGKERIRRAGKKIKSEGGLLTQDLDIGFRVLKVDSTNMQDVYYSPAEYKQSNLLALVDNIKSERTAEDLLFQIMLDLGILLSSPIKETLIEGKKVYDVADGYLLACFDNEINDEVMTEIAKQRPYYAIFRDSSLADDSVAANFEQIFATHSPTTVRKVL
ncbi:MAG: site-specific DNA-methyltransferase [Anaerolineaceae bacterium]|nr:site-specific DNA-methyltransferase [Anaerolineaceae bacterium]